MHNKMVAMQLMATRGGLAWLFEDAVAVLDLPHRSITELLQDPAGQARLSTAQVVSRHDPSAPEAQPINAFGPRTSMYGVGLNYHSKSELTGRPAPETPSVFLKSPAAVGSHGCDLVFPPSLTGEPDYEAEIGIVIGSVTSAVSESQAWEHIAGIVAVNDSTARDVMRETGNVLLAKSITGTSPIGSTMLPTDPGMRETTISVQAWVNGEQRQNSDSRDMIFPITALVSFLSRFTTLLPGDVIATGTPAGTGQDIGTYLADNDEVEIRIGSLVPLVNRIRIAETPTPGRAH